MIIQEPKINQKIKGKIIKKVFQVENSQIDSDTDDCFEITDGSIFIELDDGSCLQLWTSEWGGIKIVK